MRSSAAADHIHVTLKDGSSFDTERLLYAAGRNSNHRAISTSLPPEVTTGTRGLVVVNESYQTQCAETSTRRGDVIGFPALASTSMEQGGAVAMVHAFDLKYKTRVAPILPYAIYTIPGAVDRGDDRGAVQGEKGSRRRWAAHITATNARAATSSATRRGMVKLVFEPESLVLHGVHIIGEDAAELLHTGMMVMQIRRYDQCIHRRRLQLSDAERGLQVRRVRRPRKTSPARKTLARDTGADMKQIAELIAGPPADPCPVIRQRPGTWRGR